MPTYTGFSTVNVNKPRSTVALPGVDTTTGGLIPTNITGKKFKLTDEQLVVQDLVNAFNIKHGQKVGNPAYGTSLWSYIFEPNDLQTQQKIEDEVRRIASSDPRLIINTVNTYAQDNGILLEVELAIAPFNDASTLSVFFDNTTNKATLS